MRIPRVVIAGTGSGVGKTSISLGLVRALSNKGMNVQTFKTGPDYLDPTHLTIASGRPCYNLDGWMMEKAYVRWLFAAKCGDADIAVVEGAMGLFDGADVRTLAGSTAEIASWLDTPVLLAVNARGVAGTFAAIVKGCADFTPGLTIAGIIANNTGTERHVKMLEDALLHHNAPPLVGGIPSGAFGHLPGRQLGLVTADETSLSMETLNGLAESVEKHLDVDGIINIASSAPDIKERVHNDRHLHAGNLRIAVAMDKAFHFYYRDTLEMIENSGGNIVEFSPMKDKSVPAGATGLYLGGGYPEEHAVELSGNEEMLDSVRAFTESGKPVYAECGGLMYLSRGIETERGWHDMVGILPVKTRMLSRRKSLGYVEATLLNDSLWGERGQVFKGHEFHYSELIGEPLESEGWKKVYSLRYQREDDAAAEGYQKGNILASYVHLHFASKPEAIIHLLGKCAE
jgi:cobyrinic acid a,c-diamide synthase